MNRNVKAVWTGMCLVFGLYCAILALRTILVLGAVLLPMVIIGIAIYAVGYGLPNLGEFGRKAHDTVERKVRHVLDWADFNAPVWLWSTILGVRTFLDWLGLRVKKTT